MGQGCGELMLGQDALWPKAEWVSRLTWGLLEFARYLC